MFTSKLAKLIESYDPYGIHRLNGIKAVYILLLLYAVNFAFSIPNPYFYYFYLPITALGAETVGETIKEKYLLLFYSIVASVITVFLFDIFSISPFFCVFAFLYSLMLYWLTINHRHHTVVVVPIALSLGAYSLLYKQINVDFYVVLNNCLTTVIATIIIFAALAAFPRSYYYRLWLRALLLLIQQTMDHLSTLLRSKKLQFDPIQEHTISLVRFSNMLPRNLPIYSLLKINLLINQLHLMVSVTEEDTLINKTTSLKLLINELTCFKTAIAQEKPCTLQQTSLVILDKLINSWNYLCLKL